MVRLLSVEIVNYRSFGDSTKIDFGTGINIVVGENNVGKSTILRAIDVCSSADEQLRSSDVHTRSREQDMLVRLNFLLSDAELERALQGLVGRPVETMKLSAKLKEVIVSKSISSHWIRLGELYFSGKKLPEGQGIDLYGFLSSEALVAFAALAPGLRGPIAKTDGGEALWAALSEPSNSWRDSFLAQEKNPNTAWKFACDVQKLFQTNVLSTIKIFSEIRLRPEGTPYLGPNRGPQGPLSEVRESLDGARVADVLDTLRYGNRRDQDKWGEIRREFQELFPNLELQLSRTTNRAPRIFVVDRQTDLEAPIDTVGAGVGEAITLLAHLIAFEGAVIGIDMPELHFHPHAQRLLLRKISQYAERTQIIAVTHSPTFVTEHLENLNIVRIVGGNSLISRLPADYFTENEGYRLERHLDIWGREIFFSRAVLAVEGQTEPGAFPVFASSLRNDFDRLGITVSPMGSKDGLFLLLKMLRGFLIPYLAVCDRDALMRIDGHVDVDSRKIKTSSVISQLAELGVLLQDDLRLVSKWEVQIGSSNEYPDGIFDDLRKMSRRHDVYVLTSDFEGTMEKSVSREVLDRARSLPDSKVVRGRFLAEEAVRSRSIPPEFVEIINIIAEKAKSTRLYSSKRVSLASNPDISKLS